MIGQKLGHFEILALLGKGGMGEVYRAHDGTLGRDVAIKILPREMSGDPERIARFQREARSLATLQHPNVASVYGFEESAGVRFLVMELVEGEELAERIGRGAIVPTEVARIAHDIAAGLAAAHDQGLVHRDLKPANIRITPDGEVKILDFGLARSTASDESGANSDLANSPTITAAMTQAGTILGTAAYMSPEQARGKTADRRADVWAFGCVVYECLTGVQAFEGDTVTDVLAAIIHREPDWSKIPHDTPAGLLQVLRLCLEKSRQERLRDMADVVLLLDRLPSSGTKVETASSGGHRLGWIAATCALIAGVVVGALLFRSPGEAQQHLRIASVSQFTDMPGTQGFPSISPDGKQVVYNSATADGVDILLQRATGTNPLNLSSGGPGFDVQPAFSPDGQRIAFASTRDGGGIFVMGATGETPLRVTDSGWDPTWSPDGEEIAFVEELVVDPLSRNNYSQLSIVNLDSREARDLGNVDAMYPAWSPSGSRIAFATYLGSVQGQRDLWTVDVNTGECTPLVEGTAAEWSPQWSADGRWVYFVSDATGRSAVWRIALDEASGTPHGEPQPVTTGTDRINSISLARTGRIIAGSIQTRSEIWRADFDAATTSLAGPLSTALESSRPISMFDVSHDGGLVAYHTMDVPEGITLLSLRDSTQRGIIRDEHRNRGPQISPDGRWFVYYSNRSKSYEVWAMRIDGTGNRLLTQSPDLDLNLPYFVGNRIYFTGSRKSSEQVDRLCYATLPEGGIDAITAPLEITHVKGTRELIQSTVSRGGSWVAGYRSIEEGVMEVWALSDDSIGSEPAVRLPIPMTIAPTLSWLDDNRILYWDPQRRTHIVHDCRNGSQTPLSGLPEGAALQIAEDGNHLIAVTNEVTSDLWLIDPETE